MKLPDLPRDTGSLRLSAGATPLSSALGPSPLLLTKELQLLGEGDMSSAGRSGTSSNRLQEGRSVVVQLMFAITSSNTLRLWADLAVRSLPLALFPVLLPLLLMMELLGLMSASVSSASRSSAVPRVCSVSLVLVTLKRLPRKQVLGRGASGTSGLFALGLLAGRGATVTRI